MKYILLLLAFTHSALALDCDPQDFVGIESWINPSDSSTDSSDIPSIVRGGLCDDEILVDSTPTFGANDYAYFLPELETNPSGYHYSFSLDFAQILTAINTGKRVTFFELWTTNYTVGGELQFDARIIQIRIKKKPLNDGSGDFKWKVHVLWYSFPDGTGPVSKHTSDYVWLPSDIDKGMLYFTVNSNPQLREGTLFSVSLFSDLTQLPGNQPVLMELSETSQARNGGTALRQSVTFNSPFKTRAVYATEARLGIIDHDNGINVGDGMLFYTPYRPPSRNK